MGPVTVTIYNRNYWFYVKTRYFEIYVKEERTQKVILIAFRVDLYIICHLLDDIYEEVAQRDVTVISEKKQHLMLLQCDEEVLYSLPFII